MKQEKTDQLFKRAKELPVELSKDQVKMMVSTLPAMGLGSSWIKQLFFKPIVMSSISITIVVSGILLVNSYSTENKSISQQPNQEPVPALIEETTLSDQQLEKELPKQAVTITPERPEMKASNKIQPISPLPLKADNFIEPLLPEIIQTPLSEMSVAESPLDSQIIKYQDFDVSTEIGNESLIEGESLSTVVGNDILVNGKDLPAFRNEMLEQLMLDKLIKSERKMTKIRFRGNKIIVNKNEMPVSLHSKYEAIFKKYKIELSESMLVKFNKNSISSLNIEFEK